MLKWLSLYFHLQELRYVLPSLDYLFKSWNLFLFFCLQKKYLKDETVNEALGLVQLLRPDKN